MSRGVGYTLTPRGIYQIPSLNCSLPEAGGKGQSQLPPGGRYRGVTRKGDRASQSRRPYYKFHCVWTAGPPEEGDLSLHQPVLVDPAHNLDRREDPKGAPPKVRPRFSTQTIAKEAQGFQGGRIFTCPW